MAARLIRRLRARHLYAAAGVLALPWVLEWALHGSFGRPPAIPRIILTTGRKHR